MKTRTLLLLAAGIGFGLGSCTTGSLMTGAYQDDLYFNPQDVPPPVPVTENKAEKPNPRENPDKTLVISQIEKNSN